MNRRTKALAISPEVKQRVYERDGGLCVYCGRPGLPNAHFIPRSQSGLGVEENILTLCPQCHRDFDQGLNEDRTYMKRFFRRYFREHYPEWDELKLTYKRGI